MFNPILDAFPDNYDGYLIRTDFRIGVQIVLLMGDDDLTDGEKIATAFDLLYGAGIPKSIEKAMDGLRWYISGGSKGDDEEDENLITQDDESEDDGEKTFDFDYDAMWIYTAFRRTFGVDLNTAKLHWFEFRAMLADLGECAFTKVLEYRTKDLSGMSPKQRSSYAKLKRKYAIPRKLSEEEAEKVNAFMAALSTANKQDNT